VVYYLKVKNLLFLRIPYYTFKMSSILDDNYRELKYASNQIESTLTVQEICLKLLMRVAMRNVIG
jgi:hypothetical protein